MSLTKSNLLSVVKSQYFYKLKACSRFFLIMIITQIIGMLFCIANLSARRSMSNDIYTFHININTTIPIFIVTIICAIMVTIYLNLKEYINMDFTFVSNRISSNLSSIALVITIALFGAITFSLSACFIRIFKYLLIGSSNVIERGFYISPVELLCSSGVAFLYILLFCSVIYFATVLITKSKVFLIVIVSAIVLFPRTSLFNDVTNFYCSEYNFFMFMVKVLITASFFFIASIIMSNSMEVRK